MSREKFRFSVVIRETMVLTQEGEIITDAGLETAKSLFTDKLRKSPETFIGEPELISRERIKDEEELE